MSGRLHLSPPFCVTWKVTRGTIWSAAKTLLSFGKIREGTGMRITELAARIMVAGIAALGMMAQGLAQTVAPPAR